MPTVIDTLVANVVFRGDTTALDNVQRKLNSFSSNLNAMGRQLGLAGGAITAFAGLSVRAFANFEDEMAKIVGLVGVPAEQLAEWRKPLLDIASATAVGPQSLAEALFFVTSAGLRGKEAIEVLEQAARAQAAGMGEAKTIADLTTSAINAYGSENLSAADATDALTEAIRLGKLEPTSMANAIGRVIPLTSAMNVEFNELAGLMAAMSKTGTPVEEAVVSIQAIMTTLLNPTREAEDALSDVGLTLADLRKQVADEGVLPMLVGLKEAFDGNIESTAAMFGNVRALRGVLDLLGPQMQGNIELLDEMADSTGVLKEATEAAQQTIGFKMRQASVHGQIALLEFGRAIEPIARFIFDALTPALQRVIRWFQSGNPIVRSLAQGVAILGIGLVVLSGALFSVAAAARVTSFALSGFGVLVKIARGAVWLWRNALILTRIQMGLLSVQTWWANSALSRFAATIWTSSVGALKGLVTNLARASLGMLRFALKAIVAGISGVIAFGVALWASLIPPLIAATAAVVGFTLALLANPIVLIVAAIIGAFVALGFVIYKFRRQIVGALKTALAWVKGNWPLLVGILLGPFGIVGALVWKFRDQILGAFREVWDWLRESPIFGPVIDGIQAIIDFVRELPGRVVGILKDIPGMVADAIRDIPGLGAALEVFTGISDKVGGFFGKVKERFAQGGIVPGPLGRPLLATVHGGEMVLPVGASRVIAQMLEGFRLGPAALPQAPHYYGQMYRSSVTNKSVTVHIHEPIVIHTEATDAKGIAQELGEAIQDQIRNVAYDHDGPVER